MEFTDTGLKLDTLTEIKNTLTTDIDLAIPSFDPELPSEIMTNLIEGMSYNLFAFQNTIGDLYNQSALYSNPLYLDALGASLGIPRKAVSLAQVTITFSGTIGTVIPAGTVVSNSDGSLKFSSEAITIIDSTGTVKVACIAQGSYTQEILANTINVMVSSILGVTCNNESDGSIEVAAEDYEEYRQRLLLRLRASRPGGPDAILSEILKISGTKTSTTNLKKQLISSGSVPYNVLEAVVQGGTDQEVALALFNSILLPGIQTYSNPSDASRKREVSVVYNGKTELISFTRPNIINFNLTVKVNANLGALLIDNESLTVVLSNKFKPYFEGLSIESTLNIKTFDSLVLEALVEADKISISNNPIQSIQYTMTDASTGTTYEFDGNGQLTFNYDDLISLTEFTATL